MAEQDIHKDRESRTLARSFLEGDRRAFDKLIHIYKHEVFNVCYRFMGDYDEADDCAQEVFIKINRSLGRFRFESSLGTWIYRIAVNTCKNRLKSLDYRLRSRRVRIDGTSKTDIANGSRSPSRDLAKKEIDGLIQCAIDTLPTDQKLVVILCDVEGKSYEEITEITGLELGTVKSRLSRARRQLRDTLKGKV